MRKSGNSHYEKPCVQDFQKNYTYNGNGHCMSDFSRIHSPNVKCKIYFYTMAGIQAKESITHLSFLETEIKSNYLEQTINKK